MRASILLQVRENAARRTGSITAMRTCASDAITTGARTCMPIIASSTIRRSVAIDTIGNTRLSGRCMIRLFLFRGLIMEIVSVSIIRIHAT